MIDRRPTRGNMISIVEEDNRAVRVRPTSVQPIYTDVPIEFDAGEDFPASIGHPHRSDRITVDFVPSEDNCRPRRNRLSLEQHPMTRRRATNVFNRHSYFESKWKPLLLLIEGM